MLKPKKKNKLHLTLLSLIFTSSCASVPKPPDFYLYMHDQPRAQALCSDSDAKPCPAVPMEQTDKWLMLTPEAWQALNNYLDLLVCKLKGGTCTKGPNDSTSSEVKINADDVLKIQRQLQWMEYQLRTQKAQ